MKINNSVLKSLLTIAIPITLANILQSMYQLTDAFWVGRLGAVAVASVSVSFPILFLVMGIGIGFSIAGASLVAQYFGAKNIKMVNHSIMQSLLIGFIVSMIVGFAGYILSPLILGYLEIESNVYVCALEYLHISFLGAVFMFNFMLFQSIMNGVGRMVIPMFIVLSTVILNLFLDPLFIFGYGSFAGLGVKGAAIATVITQIIASFVGLYILFFGKNIVSLSFSDIKPDK